MDQVTANAFRERLPEAQLRESLDHIAFNVPADKLVEAARILRDEFGYSMLTDASAIDWGETASPRFTGIYHLFAWEGAKYVRLAANCPDDAAPALPSLVPLFPIANWLERETFDMFGIRFTGHPDLRRILMWDSYEYHPLRKEFPLAGHDGDLPAADVADATKAKVIPAPMMGGPFHASQNSTMWKREPRGADQSWNEKKPKPCKKD